MDNQTEVSIRFKNFVTGEKKLESYAQTLTKIQGVLGGLDTGVIRQLETSSKNTKTITDNVSDISKKVNLAFNYTTIRSFTREIMNLVKYMSSAVSKSASYLENMNLLDVAFNNNTTEAERFVNKLSEMYGLDESWGYRTVGLFKQLANAMGLSADAGDKLSRVMTQFAIDTSSLYNIDTQDAVSILQSALAGQTKPARRLGADITQTTLQTTLDNAGIQAYIGNLSYVEKRLLIVTSLLQQVTEANNDWGRTIESVANQTRILNEQWNRFTRTLGNVFLPIVSKVLPYLNGILMAMTEILSVIAVFAGYDESNFDYFSETDASVIDLQENLSGANEEAQKLNKSLRGFDKLNVITTPSSTTTGGISGGIDPKIMELFNKTADDYMSKLTDVEMKATRIRNKILEWLGFSQKTNILTGETEWTYEGIGKTLSNIVKNFGEMSTIGKVISALGIIVGAKTLLKILTTLGKILGVSGILGTLKKILTPLINIIQYIKIYSSLSGGIVGGLQAGISAWQKNLTPMQKTLTTITGLIAGYSLLKDSIKGVTEEGLSFNSFLSSFAGYASNMIGSMAALGPVLGGIVGLSTSLIESFVGIYNATKMNSDIGLEYIGTLNKLKETQMANAEYTLAELQNAKDLSTELGNLVDSEGKVIEGKETRAQTILTILNKAYGTEYELIGNNIYQNGQLVKSYQDLETEIENLYKAKVKEVKLKAYEEVYKNALNQSAELTKRIKLQKQTLQSYEDELDDYEKKQDNLTSKELKRKNELEASIPRIKANIENLEYSRQNAQKEILDYETLLQASFDNTEGAFEETLKKYENGTLNTGENLKENLKNKWKDFTTSTGKTIDDMKIKWDNLQLNPLKGTINIDANMDSANSKLAQFLNKFNKANEILGLPTIKLFADGGLPSVGQIFVANERGPELVGQIGGQSFVANQSQMMDLLDKKIGNASSGINNATFIIQVGDEEIARKVVNDLQGIAKTNGKPITIQ